MHVAVVTSHCSRLFCPVAKRLSVVTVVDSIFDAKDLSLDVASRSLFVLGVPSLGKHLQAALHRASTFPLRLGMRFLQVSVWVGLQTRFLSRPEGQFLSLRHVRASPDCIGGDIFTKAFTK